MKKIDQSRRDFIKTAAGAGVLLAATPLFTSCDTVYDAKGLPTSILGKTGVRIPKIAIGTGSRFCSITDEDKAMEMLDYALENGLYYWDTAYIYENKQTGVISEERIGKFLKHRRKEVFLSTKVTSRDPDEAMRQIEGSLKRLQTDQVDMLIIHSVLSSEEVDAMSRKGQLIEIVHRVKEQGLTRFIGFSGHTEAVAMKTMAERGDFDNMLLAMNYWRMDRNPQNREELAIPAAVENNMGVMVMKVVRPKENIDHIKATDLIRFALSLNGACGAVIGMDSLEVVKSNVELLRNFEPMNVKEKMEMAMSLSPFFNSENLEWMRKGYCDGNWG